MDVYPSGMNERGYVTNNRLGWLLYYVCALVGEGKALRLYDGVGGGSSSTYSSTPSPNG